MQLAPSKEFIEDQSMPLWTEKFASSCSGRERQNTYSPRFNTYLVLVESPRCLYLS